MKNLKALSCTISPRARGQTFVFHDDKDGLIQNRSYYSWILPPVCLPSVYLM